MVATGLGLAVLNTFSP